MKKYNREKAVISMTANKQSIYMACKSIYSIIKTCPGFHIVLCLSEEEFPRRENDLPSDLLAFVANDLIEIIWVYRDYKSLKTILPAMDKYNKVPIISANSDCIYTHNCAGELYSMWVSNKKNAITSNTMTIYPPNALEIKILNLVSPDIIELDDSNCVYSYFLSKKKVGIMTKDGMNVPKISNHSSDVCYKLLHDRFK